MVLHPPTKNCQFLLSCTSPCELCRIVHSDTRKVCREVFNDLTSIEWFKFSQLTPQNMLQTNIMWTRVHITRARMWRMYHHKVTDSFASHIETVSLLFCYTNVFASTTVRHSYQQTTPNSIWNWRGKIHRSLIPDYIKFEAGLALTSGAGCGAGPGLLASCNLPQSRLSIAGLNKKTNPSCIVYGFQPTA